MILLSALLVYLLCLPPGVATAGQHGAVENGAMVAAGERIYREGMLISGASMSGYIKGDLHAPGSAFACVSCHMRSGLGSLEGNVITTAVSAPQLYSARPAPQNTLRPGMGMAGKKPLQPPPQPPPARPAYTDQTLAAVIRGGVDSSGRLLDPIMPRYNLADDDMQALISYLKTLSKHYSPGVDAATLRFATIVTDDADPAAAQEQWRLLEDFVRTVNERSSYVDTVSNPRIKRQLAVTGRAGYRKLVLTRWQLSGAPATWRSQLEDRVRKEPVFAFIGGMSRSSWQPIHEFCEAHHIPALLPNTDLPVVSDQDWYTLYLSKGVYQEGETAASFLATAQNAVQPGQLLIIHRTSDTALQLLQGFLNSWLQRGMPLPQIVSLAPREQLTSQRLSALLAGTGIKHVVLWDGAAALPVLQELPSFPELSSVIVSAPYLGSAMYTLRDAARQRLFATYPRRLAVEEARRESFFFGASAAGGGAPVSDTAKRTYPLTRLLHQLLTEMKENFYRDYLLDLVAMSKDMEVPLYERLSFGPGQRYAAKGCYMVQLGAGSAPELLKRSEWVSH